MLVQAAVLAGSQIFDAEAAPENSLFALANIEFRMRWVETLSERDRHVCLKHEIDEIACFAGNVFGALWQ